MNSKMYNNAGPPHSLFLILFLGGLVISLLTALLLPQPYSGQYYELLIGSLVMFLWGAAGLVVVLRRELRQFGTNVKGKLAIFYGIFIMLTCWPLGLLALINALKKIFGEG